ncbi:MAG: hypothetical protein P4L46_05305 [Fimbriimonas sp.]|nr:hypothetical protein [Fimbriimonas sp.]
MKSDPTRILGWGFPILCMAVAFWVIFAQRSAFIEASNSLDLANRDVEKATKNKKGADTMLQEKKYAAVADTPDEEPTFINFLRQRATANGVSLDKWTSQSTEYGKDKNADKQDPQVTALLKGIRKISSFMTLSGPYPGLRQLMGELEESDRLYTLSNIIWNRNKVGDNTVTMSVGRYVVSTRKDEDKATP